MPEAQKTPLLERLESLWAMQPEAFRAFAGDGAWAQIWQQPPAEDAPPYELAQGGVAVIPVEGVLLRQTLGRGTAGLRDFQAALDAALAAPEVRAILLSFHSPGGQARGVKEAADAIFQARRVKPCAAFVDGLCASAAYWLAAATGAVYAGPSSTVGSIGVILRHMDKSGWNKEMGLAFTYVTAGAYKALGHPDAALSERDLGVLQARVDAIYDMFCGDVAQHMGLALENRAAWADGRDFLASEAWRLGLVTAVVHSRSEAIQNLLKETNMDNPESTNRSPDTIAAGTRQAAQRPQPLPRSGLRMGRAEMSAASAAPLASDPECRTGSAAEGYAVDAAVTRTLELMALVCGQDVADKVGALVKSGMTPEQLAAAASALSPKPAPAPEKQPESAAAPNLAEEMLAAIKAATPAALAADPADPDGVIATIQRIGKM